MTQKKVYPDGIKKETEEFTKRKKVKKLVDKLIKEIVKERTYKAFKDLGFTENEGHYFVYAKEKKTDTDSEKGGGKGTSEGKVNVTISYPKKYSGDEDSAPAVSSMQKVTTFGGKKLVSEIYLNINSNTLEITYKNTEDSGFHQQSTGPTYAIRNLEKKMSIPNISDSKQFKKKLEDMFDYICKAEAEYLTSTKIGQDDKIEKKQNASTIMENKLNKLTLTSLLEGTFDTIGDEIHKLVKESDESINGAEEDEKKELLKGDGAENEKDEVSEITTAPGGISGPFNGETNPTDIQGTSAGGAYATPMGTPQKRKLSTSAKGQDGTVVADENNEPDEYRVNEAIEKTPYGEMHKKRARMVKEDGTYKVKVDMEPGYLNVPKGMEKNGDNPESGYVMGMHGKANVNSKEELSKTGHGDLSQLDEAYNKNVKLSRKKFVSNEDNEKNNINKRYIITNQLSEEDQKRRFKQLVETKSFEHIKEENDLAGEEYDDYANKVFSAENAETCQNIESPLSSTPACGDEEGFEIVPKTKTSLIMFKLSEADIKKNKAFIKDYFTNKIVPNPRYQSE